MQPKGEGETRAEVSKSEEHGPQHPATPERMQLDHIGIVVDNFEDARRTAVEQMGLRLIREAEAPTRLRAAFYSAGSTTIEFIELSPGDERAARLSDAQARIEHIAFRTVDVIVARDRLEALGVRFSSSEPQTVSGSRSFFTIPDTTDGVMYQIFDRPQEPQGEPMASYQLIEFDRRRWHDRGGGVHTMQLVRRLEGARSFLTGITEFDPCAALPVHFHNCDESVIVLEGRARVEVASDSRFLGPYDTSYITAGTAHRFANAGDAKLRIHWTYGSINATRTVVATGETTDIADEGLFAHEGLQ